MDAMHMELESLRIEDRYSGLYKRLRTEYTNRRLPLHGHFELTSRCTLDCKMCYVHTSAVQEPERTLSGDEWISLMDAGVDAGMLYATLTGGECMVHPEFRRVYTHLKGKGIFIFLLTNATLLDEEAVAWLKTMSPRAVQVSVYGSTPEEYRQVTGSAEAFGKVDRALELLYKARIATHLSLTVSRYNYESFERLLAYARSKPHGRIIVNCAMLWPREETGRKLSDFALSLEEQEKVWQIYYRMEGKPLSPLCDEDFDTPPPQWKAGHRREYLEDGIPCAAGKCGFHIDYRGRMHPCLSYLLEKPGLPLEEGFTKAWRTVNQAAHSYTRSEECRNCRYLGQCVFCPGRYAPCSGETDGLPGKTPCDKKARMLQVIMQTKTGGKEK